MTNHQLIVLRKYDLVKHLQFKKLLSHKQKKSLRKLQHTLW